jgi:hypothetical protein
MSMTLVQTVTVGAGGASSIQFSSIPQTGTDLMVLISSRATNGDSAMNLRFNNSTSNLNMVVLTTVSSPSAFTSTGQVGNLNLNDSTADTFGNTQIYVSNYGTSANKCFYTDGVTENNGTIAVRQIQTGLWSNSAAVTTFGVFGTFAQHSSASLYLITKA